MRLRRCKYTRFQRKLIKAVNRDLSPSRALPWVRKQELVVMSMDIEVLSGEIHVRLVPRGMLEQRNQEFLKGLHDTKTE